MSTRRDGSKSSEEGEIAIQEAIPKKAEPPKYAVILNNDDYTTMEFVVEVLKRFFQKKEEQAVQIMLEIHQKGRAIAGVYQFEIAETKVAQVHDHARSNGFPLRCTLEPLL